MGLMLCVIHALVLAILTVRVRYATREERLNDNCCTPFCCFIGSGKCFLLLALLACTAVLSWYITKDRISNGHDIPPPKSSCGSGGNHTNGTSTLVYNQPYFGQQAWQAGLATFQYAITFVPTDVLNRADGSKVTSGDMFI